MAAQSMTHTALVCTLWSLVRLPFGNGYSTCLSHPVVSCVGTGLPKDLSCDQAIQSKVSWNVIRADVRNDKISPTLIQSRFYPFRWLFVCCIAFKLFSSKNFYFHVGVKNAAKTIPAIYSTLIDYSLFNQKAKFWRGGSAVPERLRNSGLGY
jgi:hypothetical protein